MTQAQRFREVQRKEFEGFLNRICHFAEYDEHFYGFDFVDEDGHWVKVKGTINEHCYFVFTSIRESTRYCLKIYSGIDREDGLSRPAGTDAIRVVAARADTAEPVRPGFKPIKRIQTWQQNLHKRMLEALHSLGANLECPVCKRRTLVLRKNKERDTIFLGCSRFPECKGSRNL